MPDPEIDIRIKTSADTKGVEETKKAVQGLKSEVKDLGTQTDAVTSIMGKLRSRLASFALGTAFTAAIGAVGVLMSRVGSEIKEILELLDLLPKKATEVSASSKRSAEDAAASVAKLAEAFEKAVKAAETLRRKQDELGDEKLNADLAGVDVLEALGPGRGGLSGSDARKRRADLRLDHVREKNAKEEKDLAEREKVLRAQQAASKSELDSADILQRNKDAKRERLLDRASKVLQIPKDDLRDRDSFEKHFQEAISRTESPAIPEGDLGGFGFHREADRPEDLRRRAEVESLAPLFPLLSSPNRRIERARERFSDASAVINEQLPEVERQKKLLRFREIGAERTNAAEAVGAADDAAKGGNAAVSQNTNLMRQMGGSMGQTLEQQNAVMKQILQQLNSQSRELKQLQDQINKSPWR